MWDQGTTHKDPEERKQIEGGGQKGCGSWLTSLEAVGFLFEMVDGGHAEVLLGTPQTLQGLQQLLQLAPYGGSGDQRTCALPDVDPSMDRGKV